jgi:hypothetical protein
MDHIHHVLLFSTFWTVVLFIPSGRGGPNLNYPFEMNSHNHRLPEGQNQFSKHRILGISIDTGDDPGY